MDDGELLLRTLAALEGLASRLPVLLPLHPRTRARLDGLSYRPATGLRLLDPLSYLDFIALEADARLVVTDSGGVQEETTALGVPCITYRTTTERPVTIELGTNRLVGVDPDALAEACEAVLSCQPHAAAPKIPLWDGDAGRRAAQCIAEFLARHGAATSSVV